MCWTEFERRPLLDVYQETNELLAQMRALGQEFALYMSVPMLRIINSFARMGPDFDACTMEKEILKDLGPLRDAVFAYAITFFAFLYGYFWGNFDAADALLPVASQMGSRSFSSTDSMLGVSFECLVLLAQVQRKKRGRFRTLWYVRRKLRKMHQWASFSPKTVLGKLFFVEAELAICIGDHRMVLRKFYLARLQSRDAGFLMQEAIMTERLGRYYMSRNEMSEAKPVLEEAIELYRQWGAIRKVEVLEQEVGSFCD